MERRELTDTEQKEIDYIAMTTITAIQAISDGKIYRKVIQDDGTTIRLRNN